MEANFDPFDLDSHAQVDDTINYLPCDQNWISNLPSNRIQSKIYDDEVSKQSV